MAVSRRTKDKIGRGMTGFAGGFLGGRESLKKNDEFSPYGDLEIDATISGIIPSGTANTLFSGEGDMEELIRKVLERTQGMQRSRQ